jgi:cytochrome P450
MTRDEDVYPDAESFKPERFIKNGSLNNEIRDPRDIVFGFGRRCVLFILSLKLKPDFPLMP